MTARRRPSEAQLRRARVLAAFARRGRAAAQKQRQRLLQEDPPDDSDLDGYAHAAWQLREAARQAVRRLNLRQLQPAMDALDDAMSGLKDYRDIIAHAVDDKMTIAWFGQFAVQLYADGSVRYLVDIRHDKHEALERFAEAVLDALSDYAGEDLRQLH